MADLNLKAAFLPAFRAGPDTFWLGMGVIALIDAVRLTLTGGSMLLPWLFIIFFTASLHINRLRDAGRQPPLVIIPLAAGIIAKSVTALFVSAFIAMDAFLVAQGVDTADSGQVMSVVSAPTFQAEYQAYLQASPDVMAQALSAASWPSMWAYWSAVGAIGFWFARLRYRPQPV